MTDQELADALVALGIIDRDSFRPKMYSLRSTDGHFVGVRYDADKIVRDARVMAEVMRRVFAAGLHFDACFVGDDEIEKRANKFEASITTNLDEIVALVWNESLERAVNEAGVRALSDG